jgi:hypothetical protein
MAAGGKDDDKMLSREEQRDVLYKLAGALSEASSVSAFVTTTFVAEYKAILLSMPANLNRHQDQGSFILNYCLDSEWSLSPSLMEQLLRGLITNEGYAELVVLRDRVSRRELPPDDPFKKTWVNGNMPFFDRETLRERLRPLFRGSDQPILRINGTAGCGKSYSREFFDHLVEQLRPDAHVVYVPLERAMGPSFPVEELADALVAPTKVSLKERPQRSTSYYPRALLRWVLNSAIQNPGMWIYALDGFDQRDILPETCELIRLLAQEITNGDYRRRFRLILIDYQAAFGKVLDAKILSESVTDPALITEDHILDCLVAHYSEHPPAGGLHVDNDELRVVARTFLAEAPPTGRARLESLFDKLNQLRQLAIAQPGGE